MPRPKSHKQEMMLAPADAADLLRRLADQLDAGGADLGQIAVETDGPVKIKQSIKAKADKVSFKLKLKYATLLTPSLTSTLGKLPELEREEIEDQPAATGPQPATEEALPARAGPSFKAVKKEMSQGFKTIKLALAEESMPPAEAISAFAQSCELMTTFADKGEPKYQDFLHHIDDLKRAGQAGDAKALARAIAEIGAMKKACHSQFK